MDDSTRMLLEALPIIARITGGYATLTDRRGVRIKTVDSEGAEIAELKGLVFDLARQAAESGTLTAGPSQIVESAEAWSLPIGDYVLSASNLERVLRDDQLQESLKQALPFIARVAGGEAVIFDAEGQRLASYDPTGEENRFIG